MSPQTTAGAPVADGAEEEAGRNDRPPTASSSGSFRRFVRAGFSTTTHGFDDQDQVIVDVDEVLGLVGRSGPTTQIMLRDAPEPVWVRAPLSEVAAALGIEVAP